MVVGRRQVVLTKTDMHSNTPRLPHPTPLPDQLREAAHLHHVSIVSLARTHSLFLHAPAIRTEHLATGTVASTHTDPVCASQRPSRRIQCSPPSVEDSKRMPTITHIRGAARKTKSAGEIFARPRHDGESCCDANCAGRH